ncbi:MAG TPA: OmpH family outer membrane protein [Alphaproteobacteria bacterium]|nr:OmpH family outer membrane protein [Alphaproteobacteria bacterium]
MIARSIRWTGIWLGLLVMAALPFPGRAQIEPPVIVVVDFQGIVRESAAAKSIQTQIDDLRASYQEEFVDIEEELRTAETELAKARNTLSDEDFLQRRRQFEGRVTEAQRTAQVRRAALDQAFEAAMDEVRSTLLEVIAEIAREEDANLVLSRSQVVLADRELDFTAEAQNRLNERLPEVAVQVPAE